jgi:hypothetical protein
MKRTLLILLIYFFTVPLLSLSGPESLVIFGEYPVVQELQKGIFKENRDEGTHSLIDYESGEGYKEKAYIEALHFINANVFGYSFFYKPGSILMKTEETFDIELKGTIGREHVSLLAEGVDNNVYRVKLEFPLTLSVRKWQSAFYTNTIRITISEGNSTFYTGWEGRSDALRDALKNLVLTDAKRTLSSKPLILKGDILMKGEPEFSVGAGRHYCKIQGFVNFVEIITYD